MAGINIENLDVGQHLAHLMWDNNNALDSLDKLYNFAREEGVRSEKWYWNKIAGQKRWAMTLRVIAILSVTIAGIIPILSPIFQTEGNQPLINPTWSSIAVAVGAAALAMDKFFGFSSAWTRYVTSAMNIKSWLIEFSYDWVSNRAILTSNTGTKIDLNNAQLQLMVNKCCAFAVKVSAAVQEETKQWVQEFQSSLSSLDQTLKQEALSSKSSAMIINVENGDKFTCGWDVEINGRKSGTHFGRTGVLTDIYPGLYQIVITGKAGNKTLHAEAASKITAGEITTLNLKLI